jgi:hypothetical protein
MWEPSSRYFPPGVWGCVGDGCSGDICYFGSDTMSAAPRGPMEYLNLSYPAAGAGVCKWASGFACGNGGPNDNFFWNRLP